MQILMNLYKTICGAAMCMLLTLSHADVVTENDFNNAFVIDFETLSVVVDDPSLIQIGLPLNLNVEVQPIALGANGLYTHFDGWGLNSNGTWGAPKTYVGMNGTGTEGLLFSFSDGPVSHVAGVMNYAIDFSALNITITVLDEGMNVLETHEIDDVITPNGINEGGFRGIARSTSDIVFFVITGDYVVLDDLTFKSVLFESGFD